jgi:thiol-disulfide isomerase/thioredoxin
MDRLSIVIVLLTACGKDDAPPPPARGESAKVEKKQVNVEAFCDRHLAGDSGPTLTFPALVGAAPPATAGHWRWLNVWATWCKPCIEEMPRLVKWQSQLAAAGHPVDLAFVSVDEKDSDLVTFKKDHPGTPDSPRIADPKKQDAWFASLGADLGQIPIHVFAAPSGHVRCVRAGGIRETDYAAIEKLLAE